jgi:hypothetical protein
LPVVAVLIESRVRLPEPERTPLREMVRHLSRQDINAQELDDMKFGRVRVAWDGEGPWACFDQTGELAGVFELWRDRIAKPTVVFDGR